MLYLVISSESVYCYLIILVSLHWVIRMFMLSAEPLVTKVWSIAQPMIKTARYSAHPISRGHFAPHNSRRTHSSPIRARYTCFFVSSKYDRSLMLEIYAVCNTVLLYRDISRVYSMFLWLAVFWRYEWRFMSKRDIPKIDVCGGQIVNHSHVFSWSRINPFVHRLSWLCVTRNFRHPLCPHCPVSVLYSTN